MPMKQVIEYLKVKKVQTYYSLYTSDKAKEKQVMLYEHTNARSFDKPKKFLGCFTGFLHTNAYSFYGKLSVKNVYCLAHVRRNFFKTLGKQPSSKSFTKTEVAYCDCMFCLERAFTDLTAEERLRLRVRNEKLAPAMEEFL